VEVIAKEKNGRAQPKLVTRLSQSNSRFEPGPLEIPAREKEAKATNESSEPKKL
jgi:hypothetical protein